MGDFFKALFDFNFQSFITMKLIKPLYIIFVVLATLGSLMVFLTTLRFSPIVALIFVPLYWLFSLVFTRVWMELIVLMFDINDRVETLSAGQQRPPVNPGSLPPL
jgi:hypothetical protein